jgi:hypothetical protein
VAIERKRKPRKPKSDLDKAHTKCWKAFSIYIRTRDCIRFKNSLTEGICVTCKRPYPFKQLQAGHFIGGRTNSVLYNEKIVYTQCYGCNGNPPFGKGGNYVEYFFFMMNSEGYTKEQLEEFNNLKFQTVKYTPFELFELADIFKEKTRKLKEDFRAKNA